MTKRNITARNSNLRTTEPFEGESLETKVRRTVKSGAPIEAISPMVYTERKEGVRKDTNIRTDKWDIAMAAMDTIAQGIRTKRAERMGANVDKPVGNSEMNVPTGNADNK